MIIAVTYMTRQRNLREKLKQREVQYVTISMKQKKKALLNPNNLGKTLSFGIKQRLQLRLRLQDFT